MDCKNTKKVDMKIIPLNSHFTVQTFIKQADTQFSRSMYPVVPNVIQIVCENQRDLREIVFPATEKVQSAALTTHFSSIFSGI